MTSIVYNGSPRHHNRIITSGNNTPPLPTTHHLSHHTSLQQSYPFASSSVSNVAPLHTGNIIMPPPSYLSSLPSTHHHSLQLHRSSKRKSAVELLAESKPFYVKSETVLDRQQQLNIRGEILSPSRTLPSQHRPPSRRCSSSGSDLLQTKLRKLLNAGDSKEAISPDIALSANKYQGERNKYNTYCNYQSPKITQELNVHPEAQSDVSVFFPSAFLSPQSLPPHPVTDDEIYSYGIDDTLILTDDYRAISPPAEYAENVTNSQPDNCSRYGYQRSYSHSQAVISDEAQYSSSYNINSHKSLPDLHAQISRHSPHSEALSCCSRGNRSNKSGSSFNRDSGGSSGHYTHRSEPCCKQKEIINTTTDYRRDSGSSTQHSGNSYYAYGIPPLRYDCMECRAKIQEEADCLLNFPTPEVPDAFKDDFNDKSRIYFEENNATTRKFYSHKNQNVSTTGEININQEPSDLSPPLGNFKRQRCLRFKNRGKLSTPASEPRCVEEDRRPILRSKSDISDRYWSKPTSNSDNKSNVEKRSKSETISQLERFFDRLGLNDDKYEEFIAPKPKPLYNSDNESDRSSAVFFSDVSTVDSNRLPDSTETNQPNSNYYRPSEPPSIVERNARIIKWLCNCKKLQLV